MSEWMGGRINIFILMQIEDQIDIVILEMSYLYDDAFTVTKLKFYDCTTLLFCVRMYFRC